ncbi:oligopeptide ABC transporter permease [Virgibacillus salexigens]|uniref:Stage 0 sporulation protein KC n=1 Tax=Virgibacillus massiliensis TaxID=1462526 RepID=A0A024Q7C5_9BACI|nr:oligopeptide ABC transporter permease [Virgibacillus massiliensis]MYL41001.1 ABC transporter permease subunit [Virgibacillus massiliensis]CDQ38197.1 Stage 0 sporulation protein KC [Virgibacillus massiliensis]
MSKTIEDIPKHQFEPAPKNSYDNEKIAKPQLSFTKDAWLRVRKNKGAVISFVILLFVVIMAIIGPYLSPHDGYAQDVTRANLPPRIPVLENWGIFDGSQEIGGTETNKYEDLNIEEYYWFGTDSLGRDLFTRTWLGTRISLYIALLAAVIDMLIGVIYGLISGFKGGRVDNIMQRILEVMSGIPNLIVVILMLLILKPGILSITLAMVITGWIGMARVVRGQVLKLKDQEYILASRTLGAKNGRLLFKHLLPNLSGVIIINTMFTIPSAIFFEAFLSFIGIGLQAPEASLGTLIEDGYKTFQFLPHLMIIPCIVICIILITCNLIGDGLRDAFDPKMRD